MAPTRTFRLDGDHDIQTPMAVAVVEEDNVFFVASSSGLHEFSLSPVRLRKTIRYQMCMDVLIAEMTSDIATADGKDSIRNGDRLLITVLSMSAGRLGPQDADILLYPYRRGEDRQTTRWEPVIKISSQHDWGRIRKLAYSEKRRRLYISTKIDHVQRGAFQTGSVWVVDLEEPEVSRRLVAKEPASFWYMAVDDERDYLIMSDRSDDLHHTIDIYSLDTGTHLKTIARSPDDVPTRKWVPYGFIFWPRAVVVDSKGRIFVVDGGRIQEFDPAVQLSVNGNTGNYVGFIALPPFNNGKGMCLVEKKHSERRLYVVGSQEVYKGRIRTASAILHRVPALFVCDVQDWCPCEDCATAVDNQYPHCTGHTLNPWVSGSARSHSCDF